MNSKETTPMDASVREDSIGHVHVNNERPCWAIKTLLAEVKDLFPETENVVVHGYNERGVGLSVTFDLTTVDPAVWELYGMLSEDTRVEEVVSDEGNCTVVFRNNARTQDLRDEFGLAEAWMILSDDGDDNGDEEESSW